jgi:hypothetical protein
MEGYMGKRAKSETRSTGDSDPGALVARVVRNIEGADPAERYVLLTDLLCAAWPTERAQSQ